MGDYKIVELAKIITSEEKLIRLIQEVFDLLNPDDWWFLETTLRNTGSNISKETWLVFSHFGSYYSPRRFQQDKYDIEIRFENLHGVLEVFCGKLPEIINIREGDFTQVYQITQQFFAWGYQLVKVKAQTGFDHYSLPSTELEIGLPKFACFHWPTIHLKSNVSGKTDYSLVAEPILNLLRSHGYKV